MTRLLPIACLLLVQASVAAGGISAEPRAPNVLLITSEDNGPELSCYGDPFVRTPHLDRLAAEFISAGEAPFFLMVNYADAHLPFLRQQQGRPAQPLSAAEVRPLPWIQRS